ncbi:RNA polymerase sigma factor [Variovorax sp. NFACC27]|uniref:RNA polymerase sigma factor n=1 Tax=unclassified Variovorax TaxID=663243 RepID=UPI00089AE410|nr:RNA polymerase sigma-70 factor, ECF subfamily [Variovorax sp. NFACC28]SEG75983.1 RNA polymerase sigma-70 factor, ECF subfamily [Variovorax sp. NFACC29]SFD01397.1 RNA polymerase sigma-70 factor, ECF subfamily [Variovorax sp. NFACC26]SFG12732.1 RNA polymerase sigma-70 factor, ECF subfamily [Variovorax sp. NFACC27]
MRDLVQELVAHYADLRRQLTRDLRDPHYAADIAQSSFERVYTAALKARGGNRGDALPDLQDANANAIESPRALLFRVARNLCVDDARRRKVAQEWAGTHAGIGTQQTAQSSEYVVAQQRVLARVVETMEQLPPRRREVFLLFRAYGHTRSEIAQRLNITEMAVAKHLLRATIDCSRAFAELRSELIEPQVVLSRPGFDAALAEDFS